MTRLEELKAAALAALDAANTAADAVYAARDARSAAIDVVWGAEDACDAARAASNAAETAWAAELKKQENSND